MINYLKSTYSIYCLIPWLSACVPVNLKTNEYLLSPGDPPVFIYLCLPFYLLYFFSYHFLFANITSSPSHAHRTQGSWGNYFLSGPSVLCTQTLSLSTPTDSDRIRRLSKGIIIYYHIHGWAVKMTLCHPNGLAWMDGWTDGYHILEFLFAIYLWLLFKV